MASDESSADVRHPGGDPMKLRLTALEQDVLFHYIEDYQDETDEAYSLVLDNILDRLPEREILSRPPSVETLIETGYLDGPLGSFDSPLVVPGDRDE